MRFPLLRASIELQSLDVVLQRSWGKAGQAIKVNDEGSPRYNEEEFLKQLTADDIDKLLAEGRFETMLPRSRANVLPPNIQGDPENYLRMIIRGDHQRDLVIKWTPRQRRAWGDPDKFEVVFPRGMPDQIIFRVIHDTERSGRGIFSVYKKSLGAQGSSTLTWAGIRRKPPSDKSKGDSIYIPIVLQTPEYIVVDVSALESYV